MNKNTVCLRSKRKLCACIRHQLLIICYSFKKISKGYTAGSLLAFFSKCRICWLSWWAK